MDKTPDQKAIEELASLLRELCDAIWNGELEEQGAETFTDPAYAKLTQLGL